MRLSKKMSVVMLLLFAASLFAGFGSAFAVSTAPLVETQWLEDNLDNPKVKIIFVDNWPSDKEEFMKNHIKGSYLMGIGALMGAMSPNPPDEAKYEGMMNRLGVNSGDHVVLYGATGKSVFTLGALWLMDYFGHENVSFLNGGLTKWSKENRPAESGMKAAPAGNFKAGSRNESIRIVGEGILKNLNNSNAVLVDVRGTDEYTGKQNVGENPRVGYIPGALDMSFLMNFNEDGTVKSAADLKAAYEAQGVTADKDVIIYCQGGIKASNTYFTLKYILGYKNVKVYVGSWGVWSRADAGKYPIVGKVVEKKEPQK